MIEENLWYRISGGGLQILSTSDCNRVAIEVVPVTLFDIGNE